VTCSVFDDQFAECELVMAFARDAVAFGLSHARTLRETMERADSCMLPEWRSKDHLTALLFAAVEALWNEATHV
jgi:hypothetical protein